MVSADTRARWRFFLEHAGYSTPPGRAACALELARAEQLFEEAEGLGVATSEIVDDDTPYDPGDFMTPDEARRLFESGKWTGPFGVVLKAGIEAAEPMPVNDPEYASLWGIVVGPAGESDPYLRVIRAELASELEEEFRQAIGDARDELEDDPEATPADRVWPAAGVAR